MDTQTADARIHSLRRKPVIAEGHPVYIHEIRIRNYMNHADSRITLSPITVLVGPNGAGKSALFDALLNFSMLARGNIRQAFGPFPYSFEATKFKGSPPKANIGFAVIMSESQNDDAKLKYEINYRQSTPQPNPTFSITSEHLERIPDNVKLFDRDEQPSPPLDRALQFIDDDCGIFAALRRSKLAGGLPIDDPLLASCTEQISQFNRFRLDPHALSYPSRIADISGPPPLLGYRGEDLATCLHHFYETKHPCLARIEELARSVFDNFTGFEFNSVGHDRIGFSVIFNDRRGTIPAARLSDGTLSFLGLSTLVTSPTPPPILCIEEPENGLTPKATTAFYAAVRRLAFGEHNGLRSQILISSHSPFIICDAWNGEDRDFIHQIKTVDGRAQIRPFTEVIEAQGIHLAKDDLGSRTHLSLSNAREIMDGYLS